jgi:hypothetical protein
MAPYRHDEYRREAIAQQIELTHDWGIWGGRNSHEKYSAGRATCAAC